MVPPGRPDRRRYYTTFPFRRQAAFAVLIAETLRPTYNTLRIVALLYAGIPFLFRHSPLPHAAPRIKSSPASRGFFRIFIRIFLSQIDIIFCKIITTKSYNTITLLGQNVNSYGNDLDEDIDFAKLLEEVAKTNIRRIRFATSNPWNWDKKIVDICKKYPNIMPYFHLPIQSGSEFILDKMNRKMKISKYIEEIEYIRKNIPSCAISTDLIVGFPNESEEDFKKTLDLYNKIKYDNAYTFIYSPREGTPAAAMNDSIPMLEKRKRLQQLNELVKKYASENNKKYVNKVLEVLVEGKSKSDDTKLSGYSPEWKVVNFTGKAKPGEIVNVRIKSASRFSLNGEIVK